VTSTSSKTDPGREIGGGLDEVRLSASSPAAGQLTPRRSATAASAAKRRSRRSSGDGCFSGTTWGPGLTARRTLEFRLAPAALELEQSGLGYQRVPPGCRFPYGHAHKKQEEVYVVLRGSGRMKVDDEIVELKEWDAVRVPRGTWRGYEAGPEGLEILVIGAPNLGEARREHVDGQRDRWTE